MGNERIYHKENVLNKLFAVDKPIIGTLHLPALPGAPNYRGEHMDELISYTLDEVQSYINGGVNGLIVENHGDIPFLKPDDLGFETIAAMTAIAAEVMKVARQHGMSVGINCLANGAIPALAMAKAVNADFIRVNQFVNAYVANEGLVEGQAGKILRYRSNIKAENIAIFADVHVKHGSHSIVADRSITEQAKDNLFFCADVLISTGFRTGNAPTEEEINEIKKDSPMPVIVGSGLTPENVEPIFRSADGAVVASYFKKDGNWWNKVEQKRVETLMRKVNELRNK